MGNALSRESHMSVTTEKIFLEAFDAHADALFRHASFRLSNRERAADLTQETFLKAWEYVRSGGEIRSYKSFLYRVLNNLIIDEYRKAKEDSLDKIVDEDPVEATELLAVGSRSEEEGRLHDELLIEKIRVLIPRLPTALREAVTLRYVDDFSPKEIAELLNVSENVVSVRIHRGVVRLRKLCDSFLLP